MSVCNEQDLVVAGGRGHSVDWDKLTSAKPNENSKLHDCQSLIFGHFYYLELPDLLPPLPNLTVVKVTHNQLRHIKAINFDIPHHIITS